MTDSRQDRLAAYLYTNGAADTLLFASARAQTDISQLERAGLGVFDPDDALLIRALAVTLRRELSREIPAGADRLNAIAAKLLRDIREANVRG